MKINSKSISMKKVFIRLAAVLIGVGFAGLASASMAALSLTGLQSNLGHSVVNLAKVFTDVSLIAGVGFVMASFFKFHQHKLNPTQVQLSQGITLLLIGAGLLLFPVMLPTATKAVFNTTSIAKTTGSAIQGLIK